MAGWRGTVATLIEWVMDEPRNDNDADDLVAADTLTWNTLMEVLAVGALRGMAEAHTALNEQCDEMLAPLDDYTMFQACEVLAATLLEDSAECEQKSAFRGAADAVGGDMLRFLEMLRFQREQSGASALSRIVGQAGLERRRAD
jgi:hypothetical protein